jgi:hypothetical protein
MDSSWRREASDARSEIAACLIDKHACRPESSHYVTLLRGYARVSEDSDWTKAPCTALTSIYRANNARLVLQISSKLARVRTNSVNQMMSALLRDPETH